MFFENPSTKQHGRDVKHMRICPACISEPSGSFTSCQHHIPYLVWSSYWYNRLYFLRSMYYETLYDCWYLFINNEANFTIHGYTWIKFKNKKKKKNTGVSSSQGTEYNSMGVALPRKWGVIKLGIMIQIAALQTKNIVLNYFVYFLYIFIYFCIINFVNGSFLNKIMVPAREPQVVSQPPQPLCSDHLRLDSHDLLHFRRDVLWRLATPWQRVSVGITF